MQVLIAEDNRVSRYALESILEEWDYEVISVSDGDEAWRVFEGEDKVSLAILDWQMPGRSGVDHPACLQLRELGNQPANRQSSHGHRPL